MPDDSVLGPFSRAPLRGLNVTYDALIRRAFQPKWWKSPRFIQVAEDGTTTVVNQRDSNPATEEFTLIEYNFSLFFGLAVQAYEATLISDDTPFDRFLRDPINAPLSPAAERGRQVFFNLNATPAPRGNCAFCHSGSLLSEASVDSRHGHRRDGSQLGRTAQRQRDAQHRRPGDGRRPWQRRPRPVRGLAVGRSPRRAGGTVVAADGTFKIPGLRNVALTAPYFHNGGEATLHDVVKFYARGGNQGGASEPDQTRDGTVIAGLRLNFNSSADADAVKADLVAFLESLTDERVRIAAAPFDRPQIFVPNGHPGNTPSSCS